MILVQGNATPEEVAAVVALLAARGGAAVEEEAPPRSLWAQPQLRQTLHPGPGAWRASSYRL